MTSLRESDLRLPLLAFVFAYYVLTIIWAEIRKYHPQVVGVTNGLSKDDDRLVKGRLYRSLIMIFTTIACCFALYPSVYKVFIPIAFFDTTWMNIAGILLLFLSLVWIVVAQSDFDKELFSNEMISRKMSDSELGAHSRKILTGYLLMFAGLTIVLANMLNLILFLFACIVFGYKKN